MSPNLWVSKIFVCPKIVCHPSADCSEQSDWRVMGKINYKLSVLDPHHMVLPRLLICAKGASTYHKKWCSPFYFSFSDCLCPLLLSYATKNETFIEFDPCYSSVANIDNKWPVWVLGYISLSEYKCQLGNSKLLPYYLLYRDGKCRHTVQKLIEFTLIAQNCV